MTVHKTTDTCPCCGRKMKRCSSCGVTQTKENTTITKNGRFNSTCKECTRLRIIKLKYKKLSYDELVALRDDHLKNADLVSKFLSDNFPQGGGTVK